MNTLCVILGRYDVLSNVQNDESVVVNLNCKTKSYL